MKKIPLTQGKFSLVDDEDYENLSRFKWYAVKDGKTYYAVRNLPRVDGKQHRQSMHRALILGEYPEIDHKDGNGLNNQKHNLRPSSRKQNGRNRRVGCDNTSGYKGVHYIKDRCKWRACITVNGKLIYLGIYNIKRHAAVVYDRASKKYFKDFSKPNFEVAL